MATVADKSLQAPNWGGTDKPYTRANRSGTATPYAAVTPSFVGEIYEWKDGTGNEAKMFKAIGTANTDWMRIAPTAETSL